MRRLWFTLLMSFLLPTAVCAQQKIASGYLIFNRWISWEEAQAGHAPADALRIENPWIYEYTRPPSGTINSLGTYWYQLPTLSPGSYQLRLDFVNHGYKAWLWNAREPDRRIEFQAGRPGTTEVDELRTAVRRIVPFTVRDEGPWYLVLQFSFIGRDTGGLWSEPQIAPGSILSHQKFIHDALVYATCGSLVIMLAYMTMIFVRRRDDYPSFFLALICFGLLLRTFGVELIACELFDPVTNSTIYNISRRIEYFSLGLVNLSFLPFVTSTFKTVFHWKKLVWSICFFSAVYMISCCFRSMEHLRTDVHWIQVLILISLAYIIWLLILAVRNREEGAFYMLAASIIPVVVFVVELLHSHLGGNIRIGHFAGTLFVFLQSQLLAKRFASASHRAEHLSRSLQSEVEKQTSQIRHIMDHIPEGLFILDAQKRIEPPYSRYMQVIFPDTPLAAQAVLPLFTRHFEGSNHDWAMMDSILEASLDEDSINWEFNREHLTETLLPAADRVYRLQWHPIEKTGKIVQFMGIIRDVTDLKRLEDEARDQEEDFRILKEFLATPKSRTRSFLGKQERLMQLMLKDAAVLNPERQQAIFAYLHTLKGNARQLQLRELSQLCHATEEPLLEAMGTGTLMVAETLKADLLRLQTKLERYQKVFLRFFDEESDKGKPGEELRDGMEQLDRDHVPLEIREEGLCSCSPELRDVLLDALGHLFRNSLAHGLAGSRNTARLFVQMRGENGLAELRMWDNGRGLNVSKIMQKALERGLIPMQQVLSFKDLAELIFSPAFSTAESVSEIAGRGIGMNAVRLLLDPFGGQVWLEPQDAAIARKKDVRDLSFIPFQTVIALRNDKHSALSSAL